MPLRKAALDVLGQLEQAIKQTESIYEASTIGSPIGKHVRHILDHFEVFVAGVETGLINYNLRSRESKAESDIKAALDRVHSLMVSMNQLPVINGAVEVETEVAISESINQRLSSSLERELAYVTSHGIHHLAYIKLLAKVEQVDLDQWVGIAPATASHLRAQ